MVENYTTYSLPRASASVLMQFSVAEFYLFGIFCLCISVEKILIITFWISLTISLDIA